MMAKKLTLTKSDAPVRCAHDEMVGIANLKPHPKNRNKHPENQIQRLAQILKYQGFRAPIRVSLMSGFITGGHGRLEAAKLNGWTRVPVNYQEYESEEQEYADLVADNAIALWAELDLKNIGEDVLPFGPDFDLDLLGLEDFTLDPSEQYDGDPDEVPETPKEAKTKRGELWLLGSHRVLCGDATDKADIERLMNGEKADMVFTDPPYGDGHAAMDTDVGGPKLVTKSHKLINDENLDFLPGTVEAIQPHLKEKSTKMLFFKWKKWADVLDACAAWGAPSAVCVWDRDDMAAAVMRFNPVHEFCFHWGSQTDKHSVSNHSNVWRCKKEYENKALHPTVKPIQILQPAIEVCTDPKWIVSDPFLGSGSTLIACEKTGRKCYGMEIEPLYVDVILTRWAKFTGKDPVREDGTTWSSLNG